MDALPHSVESFRAWGEDIERTVSLEPWPVSMFAAIAAVQAAYPDPAQEPPWLTHRLAGGCYHVRWDQLGREEMPANFVALGDAAMRVNPIFGQGCGKAAVDVTTLDGILRGLRTPQVKAEGGLVLPEGFAQEVASKLLMRTRGMFDRTRILGEQR
jgi:hypothetical protein